MNKQLRSPLTLAALFAAILALLLLPIGCGSGSYVPLAANEMSAPDAWAQANQGELTIVDVRTPQEWRQTGVVPGALEMDMQHPQGAGGFANALLAEVGGDRAAPIGLICRTGNRSGQVQKVLAREGFTRVYNIREGMVGSRAGPGWLRRGLPVESCKRC